MFSTLIIRDCALSASKIPTTVVLKATPSFPACSYDLKNDPPPVPDSWAARDVSAAQGTLEVSLLERISEGRMGVAYSAHPLHSRSLTREAWFYEQLAECQGTSIAHYYGFFSSTFSEQTNTPELLVPWRDLEHPCDPNEDEKHISWSPVLSSDWLEDDQPFPLQFWDTRNFKRDSPWNTWNFSTQDPTISVLVLELLGERCSEQWESFCDKPREGVKEDIIAVMEDVGVYGLVHHDVTAFNLLRFTGSEKETPQARCPHHNVVHDWRIIDFDRSFRMDMETADKTSKRSIRYNSAYIGNAGSFWGNCF